jgi:hypothetical protein
MEIIKAVFNIVRIWQKWYKKNVSVCVYAVERKKNWSSQANRHGSIIMVVEHK